MLTPSSVDSGSSLVIVGDEASELRQLEGIEEFRRLLASLPPDVRSTPFGRKSVWFGRRMSPPPLPSA